MDAVFAFGLAKTSVKVRLFFNNMDVVKVSRCVDETHM